MGNTDVKSFSDLQIYRVRKSWLNIKSQVGTFFILQNAINAAKKYKCNVYNDKKECVWEFKEENYV